MLNRADCTLLVSAMHLSSAVHCLCSSSRLRRTCLSTSHLANLSFRLVGPQSHFAARFVSVQPQRLSIVTRSVCSAGPSARLSVCLFCWSLCASTSAHSTIRQSVQAFVGMPVWLRCFRLPPSLPQKFFGRRPSCKNISFGTVLRTSWCALRRANRTQFAPFGMQNRAFGPYVMTNNRVPMRFFVLSLICR
jgi:hypothetical protein